MIDGPPDPPPAIEPALGERAGTPASTPPAAAEPASAPLDVSRGAVDALAADRDTGRSATALLRAGLTPAQVARLVGVEEHRLATVVAHALGLLCPGQGSGGVTGENRTDVPGRSWANTASSAGSTTPTTG